jgi:hypothetical protein
MKKNNKSNKSNKSSKTNKNTSATKARRAHSLKGVWGKVGAPPKSTNWPKKPFTMAILFLKNVKQCELSLRNKVIKGMKAGTILELMPIRQSKGTPGRPKSRFVLKEYFDAAKMTLATVKEKTETQPVVEVTAAPATVTEPQIHYAAVDAPIVNVPAAPAPAVETPQVETVAAPVIA